MSALFDHTQWRGQANNLWDIAKEQEEEDTMTKKRTEWDTELVNMARSPSTPENNQQQGEPGSDLTPRERELRASYRKYDDMFAVEHINLLR